MRPTYPRPPVGTDPRDLKNPLSVWQLTGKSTSELPSEKMNESAICGGGGDSGGGRRFL